MPFGIFNPLGQVFPAPMNVQYPQIYDALMLENIETGEVISGQTLRAILDGAQRMESSIMRKQEVVGEILSKYRAAQPTPPPMVTALPPVAMPLAVTSTPASPTPQTCPPCPTMPVSMPTFTLPSTPAPLPRPSSCPTCPPCVPATGSMTPYVPQTPPPLPGGVPEIDFNPPGNFLPPNYDKEFGQLNPLIPPPPRPGPGGYGGKCYDGFSLGPESLLYGQGLIPLCDDREPIIGPDGEVIFEGDSERDLPPPPLPPPTPQPPPPERSGDGAGKFLEISSGKIFTRDEMLAREGITPGEFEEMLARDSTPIDPGELEVPPQPDPGAICPMVSPPFCPGSSWEIYGYGPAPCRLPQFRCRTTPSQPYGCYDGATRDPGNLLDGRWVRWRPNCEDNQPLNTFRLTTR